MFFEGRFPLACAAHLFPEVLKWRKAIATRYRAGPSRAATRWPTDIVVEQRGVGIWFVLEGVGSIFRDWNEYIEH
jgi:hypothetical protein